MTEFDQFIKLHAALGIPVQVDDATGAVGHLAGWGPAAADGHYGDQPVRVVTVNGTLYVFSAGQTVYTRGSVANGRSGELLYWVTDQKVSLPDIVSQIYHGEF